MENSTDDDLITLMTFTSGFKANLLKSRLEDSGIQAFVFDENISTVHPLYNNLVGGIKLKVREADREEASILLSAENTFPLTNEAGEVISCPKCHSQNIEPGATAIKSIKSFFGFLLGVLTFSYPLHLDAMYSCGNCGQLFKRED